MNRLSVRNHRLKFKTAGKITNRFRVIQRTYPNFVKENRRMSTRNRFDLQTHSDLNRFSTQKSPRSLWQLQSSLNHTSPSSTKLDLSSALTPSLPSHSSITGVWSPGGWRWQAQSKGKGESQTQGKSPPLASA